MRGFLAWLVFILGLIAPVCAQDATSVLLPRINNLRASNGLPSYALHPALNAAAANHAQWLADNDAFDHYQDDGSGPRTRAQRAGFPTNWVSENYFKGSTLEAAWTFWRHRSPIHYAGLVSPNYDKIGIGSASGAYGNAYVLVFGNSSGRLPEASASASGSAGGSAVSGSRSYVLGLDEVGNIKHEVQPGQTIGHILLIYGYTWDEYPYLLEINGMSEADRLNMQPGSVILVPPKDGTFTPAPVTSTMSAPATETATATARPANAKPEPTASPVARQTATLAIRVRALSTEDAELVSSMTRNEESARGRLYLTALLGMAAAVQLVVIGVAAIELIRRSR